MTSVVSLNTPSSDVSIRRYKCLRGTNAHGPKKIWVPKSHIVLVANILGRKMPGFKLVPEQWMLTTHDNFKDMQIGLSVASKIDKIKSSNEILPQFGESSSQHPHTKDWKFVNYHP